MKRKITLLAVVVGLAAYGQQNHKIQNYGYDGELQQRNFSAQSHMETLEFPSTAWLDLADVSWYNDADTSFSISTAEQFAGLSQLVMQGNSFAGKTIELTQPIDLAANLWFPVGGLGVDAPFSGTFNGNNHEISNLYINLPEGDFVGLFGHVVSGTLDGIRLQNVEIAALDTAGSVVANLYGSTVTNSSADNVLITTTGYNVGGFAGGMLTDAYMENCSATNVNVTGENQVGGLVGSVWDNADIKFAYATGQVHANYVVGGLIGFSTMAFAPARDNTVEHSFSRVNVTSYMGRAGGFYGYPQFNAIIENCYSTGSATGQEFVGGFIGVTSMVVTLNNYWDTQSSGLSLAVGGVENGDPNQPFDITGHDTAMMTSAQFVQAMNSYETVWTDGPEWNDFYPVIVSNMSVGDVQLGEADFRYYPNPVKGDKLYFDRTLSGVVYNTLGQQVKVFKNQNSVDFSQLAKGVYLIQVSMDGMKTKTIKVIK